MKKYIKWLVISLYVVVFMIGVYLIFNTRDDSYLNEKGTAVTFFQYMKAIDGWNVIFFIIFLGITFVTFLLTNFGMDQLLKAIVRRKPSWKFLNTGTADFVVQYPLTIISLFIIFLLATNLYVQFGASGKKIESVEDLHEKKVAVILGTSKMLSSGKGINEYYKNRIITGAELYKTGVVKYVIVSGDGIGEAHKPGTYNETREMKADLIAAGVPEEKILIDSLGLRTTDSALRLIAVFKTIDVIYVSQAYHTTRAIVQSEFYGINALGYDAKGSPTPKIWLREILLSRPGLVYDMLLANVQPRIEGGGSVEYRQKFEVTSNRHAGLILTLAFLIWVVFRGINKWIDAKKEERSRVIIRYTAWTSGLLVGTLVLVSQVYARANWKFADELVHSVLLPLNIKTEKMVKEEIKIEAKIAEIKREEEALIIPVIMKVKETSELPKEEKKEEPKPAQTQAEFNTAVSDVPQIQQAVIESTKETAKPKKKEDDLFNTAESDDEDTNASEKSDEDEPAALSNKGLFKVKVHSSQTIVNDGTIKLRLDEPVTIGNKQYNKNFVFVGKTVVFNGRFIIVSAELDGGKEIEIKNFEGGREGNKIQARHQGKKDEVVLGEGELLTFKAF